MGKLAQALPLDSGKAALRPDQDGDRTWLGLQPDLGNRARPPLRPAPGLFAVVPRLVGVEQDAVGLPVEKRLGEFYGSAHTRNVQPFGLFSRFHGDALEAIRAHRFGVGT